METEQIEFELVGEPRTIVTEAVSFLDGALASAAGRTDEHVTHAIDPRRLLRFEHGGPPVWSVGQCTATDGSEIFVTYGLSRFIEPTAPFSHEMSIRTAPGEASMWPVFLLRQLARYQITGGRELAVGDPMVFAESITRAAMAPEHKHTMPDSALCAVGVVADPTMTNVRRVYGLHPDDHTLAELWSISGFLGEVARRDPSLTTRLDGLRWSEDSDLVAAVHRGSEREGSQTAAMVSPGVRWSRTPNGNLVEFGGGESMRRMAALIQARLRFGRHLVVHDYTPAPFSTVVFHPSDEPYMRAHGDDTLELGMTADASELVAINMAAREPNPSAVHLRLSYGP